MFQLFDVSSECFLSILHPTSSSEDGVLDMAEYCDGMLLYGVHERQAQEAFKAMTNVRYSLPSIVTPIFIPGSMCKVEA